jgi:hypothetical protein
MSVVRRAVGVLALAWLVRAILMSMQAVVGLVEKLVAFPQVPAHDQ